MGVEEYYERYEVIHGDSCPELTGGTGGDGPVHADDIDQAESEDAAGCAGVRSGRVFPLRGETHAPSGTLRRTCPLVHLPIGHGRRMASTGGVSGPLCDGALVHGPVPLSDLRPLRLAAMELGGPAPSQIVRSARGVLGTGAGPRRGDLRRLRDPPATRNRGMIWT